MKCRLCGHEFKIGENVLIHMLANHAGDLDELRSTERFITAIYKYFVIEGE